MGGIDSAQPRTVNVIGNHNGLNVYWGKKRNWKAAAHQEVLSYQESKRGGEGPCLLFISLAHGKGEGGVRAGKWNKSSIEFAWLRVRLYKRQLHRTNWLLPVGWKGTLRKETFCPYWNKSFSPSLPLFFSTSVKWLICPVLTLLAEAPIPRAATPFQPNDGPLTPHGLRTLP